jgi:hypothetical protein
MSLIELTSDEALLVEHYRLQWLIEDLLFRASIGVEAPAPTDADRDYTNKT